jgi:hypothetical protein
MTLFRAKILADNIDEKAGTEFEEMESYVIDWLEFEYGSSKMVAKHLRNLRKSVLEFEKKDTFVHLFARFCNLVPGKLRTDVLAPTLDFLEALPVNLLDKLEVKVLTKAAAIKGIEGANLCTGVVTLLDAVAALNNLRWKTDQQAQGSRRISNAEAVETSGLANFLAGKKGQQEMVINCEGRYFGDIGEQALQSVYCRRARLLDAVSAVSAFSAVSAVSVQCTNISV